MKKENLKIKIYDKVNYEPGIDINSFEEIKLEKPKIRVTKVIKESVFPILWGFAIVGSFMVNSASEKPEAITLIPTSTSMEEFIEEATDHNPHISEEEKEFLTLFAPYLVDNPYLDQNQVYNNLKRFKTVYEYQPGHILGQFSWPHNIKIEIFNVKTKEEALEESSTIGHEIFHLLSFGKNGCGFRTYESDLGDGISEGMTQILTEEYLLGRNETFTKSYWKQSIIVKFLCELIESDTMLEGYSTHNIDLVIERLGSLDGDFEKAKRLISLVDEITIEDKNGMFASSEKLNELFDILATYYKLADEDHDKKIILEHFVRYLFPSRFQFSDDIQSLHKAYFCSDLQNEFPYIEDVFGKKTILCPDLSNQNKQKRSAEKILRF